MEKKPGRSSLAVVRRSKPGQKKLGGERRHSGAELIRRSAAEGGPGSPLLLPGSPATSEPGDIILHGRSSRYMEMSNLQKGLNDEGSSGLSGISKDDNTGKGVSDLSNERKDTDNVVVAVEKTNNSNSGLKEMEKEQGPSSKVSENLPALDVNVKGRRASLKQASENTGKTNNSTVSNSGLNDKKDMDKEKGQSSKVCGNSPALDGNGKSKRGKTDNSTVIDSGLSDKKEIDKDESQSSKVSESSALDGNSKEKRGKTDTSTAINSGLKDKKGINKNEGQSSKVSENPPALDINVKGRRASLKQASENTIDTIPSDKSQDKSDKDLDKTDKDKIISDSNESTRKSKRQIVIDLKSGEVSENTKVVDNKAVVDSKRDSVSGKSKGEVNKDPKNSKDGIKPDKEKQVVNTVKQKPVTGKQENKEMKDEKNTKDQNIKQQNGGSDGNSTTVNNSAGSSSKGAGKSSMQMDKSKKKQPTRKMKVVFKKGNLGNMGRKKLKRAAKLVENKKKLKKGVVPKTQSNVKDSVTAAKAGSTKTENDVKENEAVSSSSKPVQSSSKLVASSLKPVASSVKTVASSVKPVASSSKPVQSTSKPVASSSKLISSGLKPVDCSSKLVVEKEDDAMSDTSNVTSISSMGIDGVKRKRGRPRKSIETTVPSNDNMESENSSKKRKLEDVNEKSKLKPNKRISARKSGRKVEYSARGKGGLPNEENMEDESAKELTVKVHNRDDSAKIREGSVDIIMRDSPEREDIKEKSDCISVLNEEMEKPFSQVVAFKFESLSDSFAKEHFGNALEDTLENNSETLPPSSEKTEDHHEDVHQETGNSQQETPTKQRSRKKKGSELEKLMAALEEARLPSERDKPIDTLLDLDISRSRGLRQRSVSVKGGGKAAGSSDSSEQVRRKSTSPGRPRGRPPKLKVLSEEDMGEGNVLSTAQKLQDLMNLKNKIGFKRKRGRPFKVDRAGGGGQHVETGNAASTSAAAYFLQRKRGKKGKLNLPFKSAINKVSVDKTSSALIGEKSSSAAQDYASEDTLTASECDDAASDIIPILPKLAPEPTIATSSIEEEDSDLDYSHFNLQSSPAKATGNESKSVGWKKKSSRNFPPAVQISPNSAKLAVESVMLEDAAKFVYERDIKCIQNESKEDEKTGLKLPVQTVMHGSVDDGDGCGLKMPLRISVEEEGSPAKESIQSIKDQFESVCSSIETTIGEIKDSSVQSSVRISEGRLGRGKSVKSESLVPVVEASSIGVSVEESMAESVGKVVECMIASVAENKDYVYDKHSIKDNPNYVQNLLQRTERSRSRSPSKVLSIQKGKGVKYSPLAKSGKSKPGMKIKGAVTQSAATSGNDIYDYGFSETHIPGNLDDKKASASRSVDSPPKSPDGKKSGKKMTTRGKKNKYWYLFAKQDRKGNIPALLSMPDNVDINDYKIEKSKKTVKHKKEKKKKEKKVHGDLKTAVATTTGGIVATGIVTPVISPTKSEPKVPKLVLKLPPGTLSSSNVDVMPSTPQECGNVGEVSKSTEEGSDITMDRNAYLLSQVKPCHVTLVDFINCLDLNSKANLSSMSIDDDLLPGDLSGGSIESSPVKTPVDESAANQDIISQVTQSPVSIIKPGLVESELVDKSETGLLTYGGVKYRSILPKSLIVPSDTESAPTVPSLEELAPSDTASTFQPMILNTFSISEVSSDTASSSNDGSSGLRTATNSSVSASSGLRTDSPGGLISAASSLLEAKKKKTTARKQMRKGVKAAPVISAPGKEVKDKFRCLCCTYTCSAKIVMAEHIYNHTSIVPYSCGYCNAIFGTRSGVLVHTRRSHDGIAPKIIKNSLLDEEKYYTTCENFIRMEAMGPMPKLKPPGEIDAQSLMHSSVGKSNDLLEYDKPVVESPPPVETLSLNHIIMSPQDDASPVDDTNTVITPTTNTTTTQGSLLFKCRYCQYTTVDSGTIETHVSELHQMDRRYLCPLCQVSFFKQLDSVRKHIARWHGGVQVTIELECGYEKVLKAISDNKIVTAAATSFYEPAKLVKKPTARKSITQMQPDGSRLKAIAETLRVNIEGRLKSGFSAKVSSLEVAETLLSTMVAAAPKRVMEPAAQGVLSKEEVQHTEDSIQKSDVEKEGKSEMGEVIEKVDEVIVQEKVDDDEKVNIDEKEIADDENSSSKEKAEIVSDKVADVVDTNAGNKSPDIQSEELVVENTYVFKSKTDLAPKVVTKSSSDASESTADETCISNNKQVNVSVKKPEPVKNKDEGLGGKEVSSTPPPPPLSGDSSPSKTTARASVKEVADSSQTPEHYREEEPEPVCSSSSDENPEPVREASPEYMCKEISSTSVDEEVSVADTQGKVAGNQESKVEDTKTDDKDSNGKLTSVVDVGVDDDMDGKQTVYVCNKCKANFTEFDTIIGHLYKEHGLSVDIACPYCTFTSQASKAITGHIFDSHPEYEQQVMLAAVEQDKYFIVEEISAMNLMTKTKERNKSLREEQQAEDLATDLTKSKQAVVDAVVCSDLIKSKQPVVDAVVCSSSVQVNSVVGEDVIFTTGNNVNKDAVATGDIQTLEKAAALKELKQPPLTIPSVITEADNRRSQVIVQQNDPTVINVAENRLDDEQPINCSVKGPAVVDDNILDLSLMSGVLCSGGGGLMSKAVTQVSTAYTRQPAVHHPPPSKSPRSILPRPPPPLIRMGVSPTPQLPTATTKPSSAFIPPLLSAAHHQHKPPPAYPHAAVHSAPLSRPADTKMEVLSSSDEEEDEDMLREAYSVFNLPRPGYAHAIRNSSKGAGFAAVQQATDLSSRSNNSPSPSASSLSAYTQFLARPQQHPQQQTMYQHAAAAAASIQHRIQQQQQQTGKQLQQPGTSKPPPNVVMGPNLGDKPHKFMRTLNCPYCTYKCGKPNDLHSHILTHEPNIKWTCPYCPMPNQMTKAVVEKHITNCHPGAVVIYIPFGVSTHSNRT